MKPTFEIFFPSNVAVPTDKHPSDRFGVMAIMRNWTKGFHWPMWGDLEIVRDADAEGGLRSYWRFSVLAEYQTL